jgi:hypothetical protein
MKRFCTPQLNLRKAAVNREICFNILSQARSENFKFVDPLEEAVLLFGKNDYELTQQEITYIFNSIGLHIPEFVYYFQHQNTNVQLDVNEFENHGLRTEHGTHFYYTRIAQTSFDEGGLMVLELYGTPNIYQLCTFDGYCITDYCHDLILLNDGKFIERSSSSKFGGFHVKKYESTSQTDETITIIGDLETEYLDEYINIRDRDFIEIDFGTQNIIPLDIFPKPKDRLEALKIIREVNPKFLTSQCIREYYENDLELATLVILNNPIAFTLLLPKLQKDKNLLRTLFLESTCSCLSGFVKEFELKLEFFLTDTEILYLLETSRVKYKFLSLDLQHMKPLQLMAAEVDRTLLKYLIEDNKYEILSDGDVLELIGVHVDGLFKFLPDELELSLDIYEAIIAKNFRTLIYAPPYIKNNYNVIKNTLLKAIKQKNFYIESNKDSLQLYSPLLIEDESVYQILFEGYLNLKKNEDELPF